jgi:hypothetical protein
MTNYEDNGVNLFIRLDVDDDYISFEFIPSDIRNLTKISINGPYDLINNSNDNIYIDVLNKNLTISPNKPLKGKMNFQILSDGTVIHPNEFKHKLNKIIKYPILFNLDIADSLGGRSTNRILNVC